MNRLTLLLVLLTVTSACGSPAVPAAITPLPAEELEIEEVPTTVGDFRWTDVHRFPDPSMGVVYSYGDDSVLQPDVYLYPRDTAGTVSIAELQDQGRQLIRILPVQQAAGRFDTYEVLADSIITLPLSGGGLLGSHVALLLTRNQEKLSSQQHIFALGDEFVKIRTSFPPSEETAARLDVFMKDLLRALVDSGS